MLYQLEQLLTFIRALVTAFPSQLCCRTIAGHSMYETLRVLKPYERKGRQFEWGRRPPHNWHSHLYLNPSPWTQPIHSLLVYLNVHSCHPSPGFSFRAQLDYSNPWRTGVKCPSDIVFYPCPISAAIALQAWYRKVRKSKWTDPCLTVLCKWSFRARRSSLLHNKCSRLRPVSFRPDRRSV